MERTRYPGVYKRGSRYVVVWQHREKQHKSFHRTLAEAREAKGQRQAGERTPASRATFEDYARGWLDSYRGRTSRGLGDRTRDDYRRTFRLYTLPYFRGYRIAEVEPRDVREFVRHLEGRGLGPASVRKVLAPLKAMYAEALDDGAVRSNPTAGVRVTGRRGENAREIRAMTRAELAAFLRECSGEWRLFFELLAHTGLRISEALGLMWGDIEFEDRPRLNIRRQACRGDVGELKSDYSRRTIPLSPGVAERLWGLGADRPEDELVFATRIGGHHRDENLRRRVLAPIGKAADLEWVTFHTFRHTCASLLIAAGRTPKQVQAWLGHHSPAFTLEVYGHLMDDGLGDAEFLDAVVGPGPLGEADLSLVARDVVPEAGSKLRG
jgi:integrase